MSTLTVKILEDIVNEFTDACFALAWQRNEVEADLIDPVLIRRTVRLFENAKALMIENAGEAYTSAAQAVATREGEKGFAAWFRTV